jgi:hypothetical protein
MSSITKFAITEGDFSNFFFQLRVTITEERSCPKSLLQTPKIPMDCNLLRRLNLVLTAKLIDQSDLKINSI